MNICSMLFRDINFEPTAIQPCCNMHGLRVPRFPFQGDPVDIENYLKYILSVFEELQTDTDICKGCPHLTQMPTNNVKKCTYTIAYTTVSFNMHRYLCNCKCVYCDFWKKREPGYEILPILKELYAKSLLNTDCFFSWGGGEPTIQPDFETASAWIETISPHQYIHTNALICSNVIKKLLTDNRCILNVSLDSSSAATYFRVKGIDKYTQVVKNLQRYRKCATNKFAIHLKYIIFTENNSIPEIENFLLLAARDLALQHVEYSLDFREVNTNTVSKKTLLAAAYFKKRATEFGLTPTPFFVDKTMLNLIKSITL